MIRLGFTSDEDAVCYDAACEYEPKPHGVSHAPVIFALTVEGPGFHGAFQVRSTYLDVEALRHVAEALQSYVWQEWVRQRRGVKG